MKNNRNVSLEPWPWACYLPTAGTASRTPCTTPHAPTPCHGFVVASRQRWRCFIIEFICLNGSGRRQLHSNHSIWLGVAHIQQPKKDLSMCGWAYFCVCRCVCHLVAFHLNGFSIAVWTFCINCCNEFISRQQVASFAYARPPLRPPSHQVCLICNCQLAVRVDSCIDSLCSLLILIVAFCFWCH